MFIQTEETPNPQTLKFLPGQKVLGNETASYAKKEEAENSPLAQALFDISHVENIFFGRDFITITKSAKGNWQTIKAFAITSIMDHYVSGRPVVEGLEEGVSAPAKSAPREQQCDENDPLVIQIKELLDTRVRPAVAEDGGDIIFHDFVDGIVTLELQGACSGCPSSTATLKDGVENLLKHYVPEVVSVEALNDEAAFDL